MPHMSMQGYPQMGQVLDAPYSHALAICSHRLRSPRALLSPRYVAKGGLETADFVLRRTSPLAPFLIVCQGGYPTPGQVT